MRELVKKIQNGEIDCNNQQLFFSALVKGLLLDLSSQMKIRGKNIPHVIFNTGDDTMWLLLKEYNYAEEPHKNTNEQYVYNQKPRCSVSLGSLDTIPDQLSNPYVRGEFQIEYKDQVSTLSAEFRRLPVRINVTLKYIVDSFTDSLELMQHVMTKMQYIRTFKFVYMGQTITAGYTIPDSFESEFQIDLDGTTQDEKDRKIELQLEVESTLPVYDPGTVSEIKRIMKPTLNLKTPNSLL